VGNRIKFLLNNEDGIMFLRRKCIEKFVLTRMFLYIFISQMYAVGFSFNV